MLKMQNKKQCHDMNEKATHLLPLTMLMSNMRVIMKWCKGG